MFRLTWRAPSWRTIRSCLIVASGWISPSAYSRFRCLLMVGTLTWNKSAIFGFVERIATANFEFRRRSEDLLNTNSSATAAISMLAGDGRYRAGFLSLTSEAASSHASPFLLSSVLMYPCLSNGAKQACPLAAFEKCPFQEIAVGNRSFHSLLLNGGKRGLGSDTVGIAQNTNLF